MCGLAFAFSKRGRPVGKQVFELYKNQETRGRKGFGYIAIHDGKLVNVVRTQTEEEIKPRLLGEKSELVLFHHRMPTSTKNTVGTAHPILVRHKELEYDYYLAHNGVITNDDEMKLLHEGLGYTYTTEFAEHTVAYYKDGRRETLEAEATVYNDSEALAIEMARYIEGLSNSVDIRGSVAFWAVQVEKNVKEPRVFNIFFGKNRGRDLKIVRNKKWWGVSSETGVDIDDLKLFSIELGDPTLYEQELVMDKSFKPSRVGYGYQSVSTKPSADYSGVDHAQYPQLLNAYYSRLEAEETGAPLCEFTRTLFAGFHYYVPTKHIGAGIMDRQLFTAIPALPTPSTVASTDEKAKARLEELAEKYAKLEGQLDKYEDMKDRGTMSDNACAGLAEQIQQDLDKIEEEVSTLGIEQAEVEEVMELAKEMVDYNNSLDAYQEQEVIQYS